VNKRIWLIAAILLIAVIAVIIVSPVSAATEINVPAIVPQSEYLTAAQIRAGEGNGIGISMDFIGENERIKYFSGSIYFNKKFALKYSHEEQERCWLKEYVCSIPELAPECVARYNAIRLPAPA